jgi:hypothetical protein
MYLGERYEPIQKILNDENEDEDEDEDNEEEEEEEVGREYVEDDEYGKDEDDADEEEEPQHQQPPKKITKNINGAKRNYYYQTTLKSMEELEEFRFKVMKKEKDYMYCVVVI